MGLEIGQIEKGKKLNQHFLCIIFFRRRDPSHFYEPHKWTIKFPNVPLLWRCNSIRVDLPPNYATLIEMQFHKSGPSPNCIVWIQSYTSFLVLVHKAIQCRFVKNKTLLPSTVLLLFIGGFPNLIDESFLLKPVTYLK